MVTTSRRTAAAAILLLMTMTVAFGGCSGSSTTASSTTTAAPVSSSCRFEYQAAATKLNGVARYFSQAAQNGQMNEQFTGFAGDYLDAMKSFDATVSALDCPADVKADLGALITAQSQLEPLVAQFASGGQPPVAEFNAAAKAVADAVRQVNAALGIA